MKSNSKKSEPLYELFIAAVLLALVLTLAGCKPNEPVEETSAPSDVVSESLPNNIEDDTQLKAVMGTLMKDDLYEATCVQARKTPSVTAGGTVAIPIGTIPMGKLLCIPVFVDETPCEIMVYRGASDAYVALNVCAKCATSGEGYFREIKYKDYLGCLVCMDCGTVLSEAIFNDEEGTSNDACHPYLIAREDCGQTTIGELADSWDLMQYPWLSAEGVGYGVPPAPIEQFSDSWALLVSYETLTKYMASFKELAPNYKFSIPNMGSGSGGGSASSE